MATIIRTCTTQGCQVQIRETLGQQCAIPFCRWCQRGTAYNRRIVSPHGVVLTAFPSSDATLWPWLDERERARRLAMPLWQARCQGWGRTNKENA